MSEHFLKQKKKKIKNEIRERARKREKKEINNRCIKDKISRDIRTLLLTRERTL